MAVLISFVIGSYSLQINFINKRVGMKSRLQRRVDKENSYNAQYLPRSRTPIGSNINTKAPLTPTNSQLRKKLDQNYEKLLSNDPPRQLYENIDYESSKNRGKRSNAKNRGFDQKVCNITTINDKINSLLNMVKKEKQNERNQKLDKLERERTANRSREVDSPSVDIVQQFRKQQPTVSPFTKDKYQEREFNTRNQKEQRYSVPQIQQYQFTTKNEENAKKSNQSITVVGKQGFKEEGKDLNLKHLRRKYLPDQEAPSHKHKRQASGRWERPAEEEDSRYDYTKTYQRNSQHRNTQKESQSIAQSNKSKNIDKMLEQRKKRRQQQRQDQRAKFQQSIKAPANNFEAENKKSSTLKEGENFKQYQYTNADRNHNLTQLNPTQQNRNQKINTATRLIDQQIEKIKNKIQQSENNNEKNQKKLSSHKKGLSSSHVQNKQHTTKLALKISSQVQLDTKLRQARLAFDKISGEQKWKNLQQELKDQGMKLSLEFIKELIKISSDERNPFTGQTKGSESSSDIASLFAKAQKNWEEQVCGITSMNDLIGEGFNTAQLDLSQKGNLGLEDLVCFINLYTGHFYRNRDLALIFRRLQLESGESGNSLNYQGFQTTLTV